MTYVDRIATVLIQLDEIDPPIWRRVEVPLTASLKGLHEVIQAVMPFENYHLFMFEIGDSRYGIRQPEFDDVCYVRDDKGMKLGAVVAKGITRFSYMYDFGDDWRHTITIEDTAAADPALDYPRFLKGEHRAPPEDVGGVPGFEEFLDITPSLGIGNTSGWSSDPDEINLPTIESRFGKLARRRSIGIIQG